MRNRNLLQMMTLSLLLAFVVLMATGLWQRFGGKSEALQQTHAVCGMVFIVLVFLHWAAFGRAFLALMKKRHRE